MAAKRLVGPALVATGPTTAYTVPANVKVVVRHVHVSNPHTVAVNFTMSVGAAAAATDLFNDYSLAAGAVLDWFCYLPMVAAEVIQVAASVNSVLNLVIAGDTDAAD